MFSSEYFIKFRKKAWFRTGLNQLKYWFQNKIETGLKFWCRAGKFEPGLVFVLSGIEVGLELGLSFIFFLSEK